MSPLTSSEYCRQLEITEVPEGVQSQREMEHGCRENSVCPELDPISSGTSSSAYSLPGAAPQSVRDVGQRSRVGAWAQPLTLWGRWVSLRPQPGGGAAVSCPQGGGSAIAGPGGLVSTVVGCSVLGVPGGVLTRPRFMVCFAAASEAGERECVPGGSPALEAPGAGLLAVDGVTGSPPCPGLDHGSPGVGASS